MRIMFRKNEPRIDLCCRMTAWCASMRHVTPHCGMSNVWITHVADINESHCTCEWGMTHIYKSCHTCEWSLSCYNKDLCVARSCETATHTSVCARAHTNTHLHTHTHVFTIDCRSSGLSNSTNDCFWTNYIYKCMCHVTHFKEPCRLYEWVLARIQTSHVKHMK